MNILVTGGNGFIGKRLVERLQRDGEHRVKVASRDPDSCGISELFRVEEGLQQTDWTPALRGVECVVHLAGVSFVSDVPSDAELRRLKAINVETTLKLAKQSAAEGVKRFVFMSSAKVNGEATDNVPFSSKDAANPQDAYSVSKFEAEQGLLDISNRTGLEIVILRPPMVYGLGAKGNFLKLVRLVNARIPLPLGSVDNKRSFIGIKNLIDVIAICLKHPSAANETLLVSDGCDLSTAKFVKLIAEARNKSIITFKIPTLILLLLAVSVGKRRLAVSLLGSFQLDISATERILDWEPGYSVVDNLRD